MATTRFSPEIPRRLVLTVDVPQRLSNAAINESVTMAAARLRFLLGAQYREQIKERLAARYGKGCA